MPHGEINTQPPHDDDGQLQLHASPVKRFARIAVAGVLVFFLVLVLAGGGMFFLLQGSTIENKTLTSQIKSSISNLLGPEYEVELGQTDLELQGINQVAVASRDVVIRSKKSNSDLLHLKNVVVGLPIMAMLRGETKIQKLTIRDASIQLSELMGNPKGSVPPHLESPLRDMSKLLKRMRKQMMLGSLGSFEMTNSRLLGLRSNQQADIASSDTDTSANEEGKSEVEEGLLLETLALTLDDNDHISLQIEAKSAKSNIRARGLYKHARDDIATLEVDFKGLELAEFLPPITEEARFAGDGSTSAQIDLHFAADDTPRQSTVTLQLDDGQLKLGKRGLMPFHGAQLNFRIFPVLNRIALERSRLQIGGLTMQVVGAFTPSTPDEGFAGTVDYTMVMERGEMKVETSSDRIIPASMVVDGEYDPQRRLLSVDQWNFRVPGGAIVGSASVGFDGETPSLVMQGQTSGFPVNAAKQFWPIFLAYPARDWVQRHVVGGEITNATLDAAIPSGILGRLHLGARFEKNQLKLKLDASDVRFDTFGNLPPVTRASGTVTVNDMRTVVKLESGKAYAPNGESIDVREGSLEIGDFAVRPAIAKISMLAEGPLSTLARIANSKPLNVMNRLSMKPGNWTGSGEVDLVAEFPLRKGVKGEDVAWQSFVRIDNAKSKVAISGRRISDADVTIDVSKTKALIRGKATIDGIRGNVALIEPVGKNSSTKRKRTMTALMDAAARKKIGLVVEPVVRGPVLVTMEQREGRKLADISVDLTDAELALPWIGWLKGKGIASKATFKMQNTSKGTRIEDMEISGQGFYMNGAIRFDKKGVVSADIPKLALNEGDNLAVRIRRDKGRFTITANGKRFDGRSLINKVLHQEGVADAQGNATFNLAANIESVQGFSSTPAKNLVLHYNVDNGWLNGLKMSALIGRAQTSTIDAATTGETTLFRIRSENSGWALAFLDIYSRMQKGVMVADLRRNRGQPFIGDVIVENFDIVNEPKLKALISNNEWRESDRGDQAIRQLDKIPTNRVRFLQAKSAIEKGENTLKLDGSLAGVQIGLTYNGTLYDKSDRMNLRGTFMPAFGISRAVSAIPLVGELLSNGRDGGLVGISYHLTGPRISPKLQLNPISIVAPGVFKRIFEGPRNAN